MIRLIFPVMVILCLGVRLVIRLILTGMVILIHEPYGSG